MAIGVVGPPRRRGLGRHAAVGRAQVLTRAALLTTSLDHMSDRSRPRVGAQGFCADALPFAVAVSCIKGQRCGGAKSNRHEVSPAPPPMEQLRVHTSRRCRRCKVWAAAR